MTGQSGAVIGVDVGGTHTDVEVQFEGRWVQGKALTTYDDFSRGLLGAIDVAAAQLGLELRQLLSQTKLIMNRTTVVINAVTQMKGSRVGVLVTAGFRDAFRFAGGPRLAVVDNHLQRNVPDLVPREAIMEITERIDGQGRAIRAVDREEVERATRHLVDDLKADMMAICFSSSYINPQYELMAERVIRESYPDIFVTPSLRVYPMMGETRRWTNVRYRTGHRVRALERGQTWWSPGARRLQVWNSCERRAGREARAPSRLIFLPSGDEVHLNS
jgi:N-methylhydantoinase A